jgi:GDP-4-dehydro-6-deoxy-D-mannose reductase
VDPLATHNLLEALRTRTPEARVLVVSSSAVYGHAPSLPIPEVCPLRPTTLYGVAKASMELVAQRFFATYGLAVVCARPFNLVGPGEPGAMLTSTLATQIGRLQPGDSPPPIQLRHRATARDYLDVRDAVRAYVALSSRGRPGETYNVCSGRATPIGLLAEILIDIAGVAVSIEETVGSPAPGDVLTQAGDTTKLVAATGFRPQVPLERSLADLLASVRQQPGA